MREPFGCSNSSAGPPRAGAVADLGDLEIGVHRDADALEFAARFQLFDEVPQVFVFHMPSAREWAVGGVAAAAVRSCGDGQR
jgi:hypothetical protein